MGCYHIKRLITLISDNIKRLSMYQLIFLLNINFLEVGQKSNLLEGEPKKLCLVDGKKMLIHCQQQLLHTISKVNY
jgi:hypothetical protein